MARSKEDNNWLEKIYKNTKGSNALLGSLSTAVKGVVGNLLSVFTDAISTGAKMEETAAKFGASFGTMSKDMHTLSDTMQKSGVPANVYEAMILKLQANRLGLDLNTKSVQDMYKVSLATGENFNTWGQGIVDATIGTRESTEAQGRLFSAVENNSRAFNMTRAELVGALKSLNRSTTNLFAATGGSIAAAGEFSTLMKGLLPDQALFGEAMNTFTRQFTMGGLTESIAMGFPVDHFLEGNATAAQMLAATLDQGDMAQSLLSQEGRNAIVGREAMKASFGDLASKISVKEAIIKRAEMLLGKAEIEGLTNREIAERVHKETARRAKDAQDLSNTWNMVKREIVTPFINEGAKFFVRVKELFGAEWLKGALKAAFTALGKIIFGFGTLLISGIEKVAEIFGFDEVAASMRDVKSSMNTLSSTVKSTWGGGGGGGAGGGGTSFGLNPRNSAAKVLGASKTGAKTGAATPTTTPPNPLSKSVATVTPPPTIDPPKVIKTSPEQKEADIKAEKQREEGNELLREAIRLGWVVNETKPFTGPPAPLPAVRIPGEQLGRTGGNY